MAGQADVGGGSKVDPGSFENLTVLSRFTWKTVFCRAAWTAQMMEPTAASMSTAPTMRLVFT
jgi:hypothetical protein